MREYKFRLWDKEKEIMLDVEKIDFDDCYYGGEMYVNTTDGSDYWNNELYSLMQYTGLHDKNGKEIWEGDIVKSFFVDTDEAGNEIYKYYIMEVKYDEVLCSYKIDKFMNLEVIGNIYENKELLNETNR